METPSHRAARLVGALEDLLSQETASFRARNFEVVGALQERARPLLEALKSASPDDAALRERIATLVSRRHANAAWLEEEIAQVRARLQEITQAQSRVARLAPAYRAPVATSNRLSAKG